MFTRRAGFAPLVFLGVGVLIVAALAVGLLESDAARSHDAATVASAPAGPCTSGQATCSTYYVSRRGSDDNSGRSPDEAWRTVRRVNAARLEPGNRVLFEASRTFADSPLQPRRSGTRTRHITYGSFGNGKARLPEGIHLRGVSGVTLQDLEISGARQGVLATGRGPVRDITIVRLLIRRVGIGINSAHRLNRRWTIRDSTISRTRDSGMILEGTRFTVVRNTIVDTGTDRSIPYGKHGIYLKASDARVSHNVIRGAQANGVSVRYRNSVVDHNTVSDVPIGIAWFPGDEISGTSRWRDNRIRDTTSAGIYVSPRDRGVATRERFVITGNELSKLAGVYLELPPTAGSYTVTDNALE